MKFDYQLIDVDHHYYEPDDCYTRHIEPRYRDQALRPIELEDVEGLRRWAVGDRFVSFIPNNPADMVPGPGALADYFAGRAPLALSNLIDPREEPPLMQRGPRLEQLTEQGIEAALIIPTVGVLFEADFRDQVDVLCANYRAFNRWVEEDWGFGADGRIYGIPVMTLADMDWAIEEVDRLAAAGSRFLWLKTGPFNGHSPADPCFDPFWARVEEAGLKTIFHIGGGEFTYLYGSHWSEEPGCTVLELTAFQNYLCNGDRPISDTLAALVLHNLFGRFPGLQVLSIEHGSSWVAPLLRSIDKAAKMGRNSNWIGGMVWDTPSDVFRNHIYVTPYHEDNIPELVKLIGADRVLFGSDFPHPEGVAVPSDFADGLIGLTETETRAIMRDNAAALLGL